MCHLIAGIDCPRGSRPGPGGTTIASDPYGEEATVFTKEMCLQREVRWNKPFDLYPANIFFSENVISLHSSTPARLHTFMEIDHEIISTVILLPSAESIKKGCCQLQVKVCA